MLYILSMNINGYIPFLINMLDTIVRGWKYTNCLSLGRGCLMWVPGKPSIHIMWPTLLKPLGIFSPGSNPPWRGLVYWLVPEVHIFKRMLTESKAFLESLGMFGLWHRPTLKRPCAKLVWLVGRMANRENILSSHH